MTCANCDASRIKELRVDIVNVSATTVALQAQLNTENQKLLSTASGGAVMSGVEFQFSDYYLNFRGILIINM